MMAILLNSTKTKISNNSHKIAIIKIEKDIDENVNFFDKDKQKKISFIDLGLVLKNLKIFRELFHSDKDKLNHTSRGNDKKDYSTCKFLV